MAKVCMDKKEFNKEHKELGKILKKGTQKERVKEANKQEWERKGRS
jgi:hypothetical protein